MRIKQELFERNSTTEFEREIRSRIDACAGIIHVRTKEIQRAAISCRKIALSEASLYKEWDINRGIVEYDASNYTDSLKAGKPCPQFGDAIKGVFDGLAEFQKKDKLQYIAFVDPSKFWEAPACVDWWRKAAHILPQTNVRLIIITPDDPPPKIMADLMTTVRLDPPGFQELMDGAAQLFSTQESDLTFSGIDDEENMKALCYSGSGMTLNTFEDVLSLAISKNHDGSAVSVDSLIEEVGRAKTDVVNRNDILELYQPEDMSNVGGMENLKQWINDRKNCYSDEAADFGIEPPKGMVFVGPPGTGKSLAAKAVASEFRVPLVRLDFGRVFNSLVGQSEERMREALSMCEHMAPVVLFADEIDKGLGGIGSGGDAGTSSRVLGTYLTWLNDCKAPVFNMVTANNISHLPPELMRRGRFDAIFATGLPNSNERLAVLKIHMSMRGWDPDQYKSPEMNKAVEASKGYVPAEIESAVKDGLITAFTAEEDFEPRHVVDALKVMVPLSQSYNEQIQLMTAWAKANATPASKTYDTVDDDGKVVELGGRNVRRRSRPKNSED
jgi:ATP-dependent 26S proteasome regulatory subunit